MPPLVGLLVPVPVAPGDAPLPLPLPLQAEISNVATAMKAAATAARRRTVISDSVSLAGYRRVTGRTWVARAAGRNTQPARSSCPSAGALFSGPFGWVG